ncbi:hypothetical protein [Pseudoxanthomonas mexicana]|jgi:hypothetical protein
MTGILANLETNLRKAACILLVEIIGGLLLFFLLPLFGVERDWIVLFIWTVNLPAAWFLALAARQQGRNPWFYGFGSLPPLLALFNFLTLSAASRMQGNAA